jgi:DNA helicase II / ATP-dependent DNA helicase PcrA
MDLFPLTRLQEQAVRHRGSPLMVLAGPGTGKTRTLTYRIAYLITAGIARSDQILAVTFTNKAAEEMRSRIGELGRGTEGFCPPWISTFHGFCFRFLQENLSTSFQLLSENEVLVFLREMVREQFPDFPTLSLKELARRISWAKNTLVFQNPSITLPPWDRYPNWPDCYQVYQKKLEAGGFWGFDELLLQAITHLEGDPDLRTAFQARFPFVFVDEFQDINPSQYHLFQLLTRNHGEWMVIGDPHQAIYGFRGAKALFFSHLQQDSPALKTITLDETFRLNQTILAASGQVLEGTISDKPIGLVTRLKGESTIKVVELPSAEEEAEYLTRVIEEEMGGLSLSSKGMDSPSDFRQHPLRSFAENRKGNPFLSRTDSVPPFLLQ